MPILIHFGIGLLLGLGLVVAGMADPAKVLNFLDLAAIPLGGRAGGWDASPAFVMAGAIAVTFTGYRLVLRLRQPLLGGQFQVPAVTAIDAPILTGPAIFGTGWGLAGFCPGPALTALAVGGAPAWIFAAAMFAGMMAARMLTILGQGGGGEHRRSPVAVRDEHSGDSRRKQSAVIFAL